MGQQTIHHEGDSAAERSRVWALLDNTMLWPTWTPIEKVEIQETGDLNGIGEIRTFTTGRVTVEERVVEKTPLVRYSYVLLSGLAVRDYRAVIELSDAAEGGTHITWHTTFGLASLALGGSIAVRSTRPPMSSWWVWQNAPR